MGKLLFFSSYKILVFWHLRIHSMKAFKSSPLKLGGVLEFTSVFTCVSSRDPLLGVRVLCHPRFIGSATGP